MSNLLLHSGIRLLDAIIFLFCIGIVVLIGYLYLRKQQQRWSSIARRDREGLATELSNALQKIGALEEALERSREKYEAARTKAFYDELLSTVGHEFERDVEFIRKNSQEIIEGIKKQPSLEREQILILQDKQERVLTVCYELLQHVENILGCLAPTKGTLDIVRIKNEVNEVVKNLYTYGEAKRVMVQLEFPDLDLDPITVNRTSIRQILANVILNAIKYSHPESIVNVRLFLEENSAEERMLCVEVKDRGIGIAEGDKETIFELGTRADGLIEPGNGVGLPFARGLARQHGGDIVLVNSTPNQGSTFKIVLPYQ